VLAASNQYHEVMVAFDAETNDQLGWTLMCGPDAILKDMFAFMPITGDVAFAGGDEKVGGLGAGGGEGEEMRKEKRKIGLIAAVGVDKKARGRGVGLAMVVRAMEVSLHTISNSHFYVGTLMVELGMCWRCESGFHDAVAYICFGQNLKERGMEGIFIDSVAIRDFYEKLGFEMRWEYESWESVEGGEGKCN